MEYESELDKLCSLQGEFIPLLWDLEETEY